MVGPSSLEDRTRSRRGGLAGMPTCNGPSTVCQSRHSPSHSTGEGEEARESSGSHVRWSGPTLAKLKKVQSAAVVLAFRWSSANLSFRDPSDGWQSWTMCGRGRTLNRSKGSVGEVRLEAEQCCPAFSTTPNVDSELLRSQVELQRAATPVLPRTAPVWMAHFHWTLCFHCPLPYPGRGTLAKLPQLRVEEEVRRRRFARWPVSRESRYGMPGFPIGEARLHRGRHVVPRRDDELPGRSPARCKIWTLVTHHVSLDRPSLSCCSEQI